MANRQQLWNTLNGSLFNPNFNRPIGTNQPQNVGAAPANSEVPPSLLLDYTAAEFVDYWLEKNLTIPNTNVNNPYFGLQFLVNHINNVRAANPNDTLRLTSEGDVVRMTQQYILNLVEPAASALIARAAQLVNNGQWALKSDSEWDIGRGRVDLAYSVYQPNNPAVSRAILYVEFKTVNTVNATHWAYNLFNQNGPVFGYANRRAIKTTGNFPQNVTTHAKYNLTDAQTRTNWTGQGNAASIASQLNNYFVRNQLYNGQRVPYQICFDSSNAIMFDYYRSNNTTPQQATRDKKRVGFCFLNGANMPTMVLFLIAALYAGAYDAIGWNF